MRLSLKIFILMFTVAFTISGATGSFFYFQSKGAMLDAVRDQLQTAAKAFAETISGDDLETLTRPEHADTAEYKKIQKILHNITQTNTDFLFAYTMRMQDGEVVFVVDSPPSDDSGDGIISEDEMSEPVGTVYPDPPATLLRGFTQPSSDDRPYVDQWGWSISGYAPVQDSNGRNVGLLGIDMDLARFEEKLSAIKVAGMASLVIALILAAGLTLLFTRTILRPVRSMQAGFERVINGDLETRLEVKGNDELAWLTRHFNQMVAELREKQLLTATMGKMMPKNVLSGVLSHELKLGGEIVWVTIVFCDLRNFTAISEKLPPKILVGLLNDYFTEMVKIVEKNSGIVDKFIGDKIMAVFGHPAPSGNDCQNALNAGLEMIAMCEELNKKLGLKNDLRLENSIGIHSGQVLAGNIGSPERMEFTFIGDAVNIAARLEAVTRKIDTRLAVSEVTAQDISPLPGSLEYIGIRLLDGRTEKLGVYTLRKA
ncbi:MAG: adenylate/guanylate cyclase domain-containing protein [Desulfonatronovibrio sp.]